MPLVRNAATGVAVAALWIVALGIAYFYRDFAKLKIAGPLYASETFFAIWLAAALTTSTLTSRQWLQNATKTLAPFLAFLGWGSILLAIDLLFRRQEIISLERVLQHSMLFVYPAMWALAGYWLARTDRRALRFLMLAILAVNAFQSTINLSSRTELDYQENPYLRILAINLSLGTLLPAAFLYFLRQALWPQKTVRRAQTWLLALSLGILGFIPYWRMWTSSMQRTALLQLVALMLLGPWLLTRDLRKSAITSLAALSLFTVGVGVSYGVTRLASPTTAGKVGSAAPAPGFLSSLEHSDDKNHGPHDNERFRFRKSQWSFALSDWMQRPLTGIGFIPPVPSHLFPGVKNDGIFGGASHYRSLNGKPVNGPHNSYLSVLARMGPLGLLLLAVMAWSWVKRTVPTAAQASTLGLDGLLLLIIPINGTIYAMFNIGFESPFNSLLLWLVAGAGLGARTKA